jgi:hypothetical protein
MSAVCFLLDEHVPLIIQAQLEQMEPGNRISTTTVVRPDNEADATSGPLLLGPSAA